MRFCRTLSHSPRGMPFSGPRSGVEGTLSHSRVSLLTKGGTRMSTVSPILKVQDLVKHYRLKGNAVVRALDGVSFEVQAGETLSLVGESGCGKTTIGRVILCLVKATSGEIILDGEHIEGLAEARLRPMRRRMQVVFQDPFSSLNPRMRVRDILAEPIRNFKLARNASE